MSDICYKGNEAILISAEETQHGGAKQTKSTSYAAAQSTSSCHTIRVYRGHVSIT